MPVTQSDLQKNHTINEDGTKGCGKSMLPMNVIALPEASEWYCQPCHRSFRMEREVAEIFNMNERRVK